MSAMIVSGGTSHALEYVVYVWMHACMIARITQIGHTTTILKSVSSIHNYKLCSFKWSSLRTKSTPLNFDFFIVGQRPMLNTHAPKQSFQKRNCDSAQVQVQQNKPTHSNCQLLPLTLTSSKTTKPFTQIKA